MTRINFLIRKPSLGILVFLLIFPLDSIAYILGNSLDINVPLGFVGVLLAFISLVFVFLEKGRSLNYILWYAVLFVPLVFLTVASHRAGFREYFILAKSLSLFYAGHCFFQWISGRDVGEGNGFAFWLIFFFSIIFLSLLDDKGLNYLRLSDGFLIFSLLLIAMTKSRSGFVLILSLSVVVLYKLGSRFSLAAYLFSVFFFLFFKSGLILKFLYMLLALVSAAFLYFLGYYLFLGLESVHDNRLLRLLFSAEHDTSLTARSHMLSDSFDVFFLNPWLGDYKYYQSSEEGSYAHNFMSFWSEFGVFGVMFTFFMFSMSFLSVWFSVRMLMTDRQCARFVFLGTVYLLLGVLFAKSYHWSPMYFLFGVVLAFFAENQSSKKRNEHHIPPPAPSRP